MSTIESVEYNNLVRRKDETESIVLATSATPYTAGMLVSLQNTGKYEHAIVINPEDTPAGTELPFSEQKIYVLSEDVDATAADQTTVGYTGEFNRASITFAGAQVEADIAGTLQAKKIILSDWSVE